MESKIYIRKNNISYLNNGKVAQNYDIYSTQITNKKKIKYKPTNGKLFTKELTIANQNSNIKKKNINKDENKSLISWFTNTLNPLNHIPLVSTVNKIARRTNSQLDIAQAAIGGAIYGGGPAGLMKGIGSWFLSKLIPKEIFIGIVKGSKDSPIEESKLKKNDSPEDKTKLENLSKSSQVEYQKKIDTITLNNTSENKEKKISNKFINFYSTEPKQNRNVIDTDA